MSKHWILILSVLSIFFVYGILNACHTNDNIENSSAAINNVKTQPQYIENEGNIISDGDYTSQVGDSLTEKYTYNYDDVEVKPEFPGGDEALDKWIYSNLQFPADADCVSGRVKVAFIIDKEGKLTNAKITKRLHPALERESLRLIEIMPHWKPGIHNGKNVNVRHELTFTFKLIF